MIILWLLFIKGIITGLLLSIPFGPVGIYCMEKTLSEGRMKGFTAAMGMVTSDLFYTALGFFFLDQVDTWILRYELYFKFIVGFLLILVSFGKLKKRREMKHIETSPAGYIKSYTTTFAIALGNLQNFFTIWLIFSTLRVYADVHRGWIVMLMAGVLTGGAAEWTFITLGLTHWKKFVSKENLLKVTRIMGILIFGFGLFILSMAVKQLVALRCVNLFRRLIPHFSLLSLRT